MLDGDPGHVVLEPVVSDLRGVAVATPDPVLGPFNQIADEPIAAEGGLDPVGGRKAEIVAEDEIVVGPALPRVHSRLTGPEEQPVPGVGHRIVGDDVAGALLIEQQRRRVLAPVVNPVAIPANGVVDPVVHDPVVGGAVESDPEPGEVGKIVVPDLEFG